MALSKHHDASIDREAAVGEANTRADVSDAGATCSPEWRLRTSCSDATFFGEESGGSCIGNEGEDVASNAAGGGGQSEPVVEVSNDDDDGEDAFGEAFTDADEVDTGAGWGTSRRHRSKPKKPSNPRSFRIEPSIDR